LFVGPAPPPAGLAFAKLSAGHDEAFVPALPTPEHRRRRAIVDLVRMFLRQADHHACMPDDRKLRQDERGKPFGSCLRRQAGEGLRDLLVSGNPFAGTSEGTPDVFRRAGL
jgi:hypothetical protein